MRIGIFRKNRPKLAVGKMHGLFRTSTKGDASSTDATTHPSIKPSLTLTLSEDSMEEKQVKELLTPTDSLRVNCNESITELDDSDRTLDDMSPSNTFALYRRNEQGPTKEEEEEEEEEDDEEESGESLVPSTDFVIDQDEDSLTYSIISAKSPKVQQIATIVFTETDLMANELNHMRELAQKQEEIAKLQTVLNELRAQMARKEKELKESREKLSRTEGELIEAQTENVCLRVEISDTKAELKSSKETLGTVSSTLIQC